MLFAWTINVDITPEHCRIDLPNTCRVWVFGSRANHTAQAYSDLEIAFKESRLPFTVAVVGLH
jgi:predicted nucleotidyltransferase